MVYDELTKMLSLSLLAMLGRCIVHHAVYKLSNGAVIRHTAALLSVLHVMKCYGKLRVLIHIMSRAAARNPVSCSWL